MLKKKLDEKTISIRVSTRLGGSAYNDRPKLSSHT
tara:strand:+ start:253 stop:357 length:105 start_codon:yes stop_codon:yes gene_type:complete